MSDMPLETLLSDPRHRRRSAAPARLSRSWVHLCNGLDPRRDGGMVPSILGMTGALSQLREGVTIVTPTPSRIDPSRLAAGLTLEGPETKLEEAVRSAEVVHLHGLWQAQTRRGARAARAAGVPYLVAAHGMAEPWALRHKYWKKRVYLALVESKNLRRASCLHALSRPEIGHLRTIAPWTPICFIPNGVDLDVRPGLAAPVGPGGGTSGAARQVRAALLRAARTSRKGSTCWPRPSAGSPPTIRTCISCSPATTREPGRRSATGWSSSAWPRG